MITSTITSPLPPFVSSGYYSKPFFYNSHTKQLSRPPCVRSYKHKDIHQARISFYLSEKFLRVPRSLKTYLNNDHNVKTVQWRCSSIHFLKCLLVFFYSPYFSFNPSSSSTVHCFNSWLFSVSSFIIFSPYFSISFKV